MDSASARDDAGNREPGAQLRFDFASGRSQEELSRFFQDRLQGRLVSLVLTDNRQRILSAARDPRRPEGIRLRLHQSFCRADEALLEIVADFAAGRLRGPARQRAIAAFRQFFVRQGAGQAPSRRRRSSPLVTAGRHFDLEAIRDQVARELLPDFPPTPITWGRAAPARAATLRRPRRRSLRLGSFDAQRRLIRIHPVLDQRQVPLYVVRAVVYHEMLHAIVPAEEGGRRRRIHTPEFRRRERLSPDHLPAESWLAENLDRLLKLRHRRC
jgi:hypothetical protein